MRGSPIFREALSHAHRGQPFAALDQILASAPLETCGKEATSGELIMNQTSRSRPPSFRPVNTKKHKKCTISRNPPARALGGRAGILPRNTQGVALENHRMRAFFLEKALCLGETAR